MLAGRLRSGPAADVAIAVMFLAATLAVGLLIVRELTAIRSPAASAPSRSPGVVPASLPALSIAVSVLPLPDGQELRVGDTAEKVAAVLQKAVQTAPPAEEEGRIGPRTTRRYQYGSLTFTLVLERFESNGGVRLAAIYIQ